MKNPLLRLLPALFLLIPMFSYSQFIKQWDFYLPSGYISPLSYNINSNNFLKTIQVDDEHFVVLGRSKTVGLDAKIYLFKFNTQGDIIWEYNYEKVASIGVYPHDFTIDQEGNILVIGKVTTFFEQDEEESYETANYLLFKLSPDADLIWEKELPTMDFYVNYGSSVIVDDSGDIYTLGKLVNDFDNDVLLHKFDSEGNLIYARKINSYIPQNLKIVNDILYVVTDQTFTLGIIYRYSLSGEKIDSYDLNIGSKKPVFDQEGNVYNFSFTGAFRLDKYDDVGNFLWTYYKETNLPSNIYADELTDCVIDQEGNIYVTGRYYGENYGNNDLYTNCDILTVKLDPEGKVIWENIYNYDNTRSCQIGKRIQLDHEGNAYVLGYQSVEKNGNIFASADMVLLKYNAEGERIDSVYHNGPADGEDYGINLVVQKDSIYVLGYSRSVDMTYSFNVLKYATKLKDNTQETYINEGHVYPNPSNGKIFVKCDSKLSQVKIFDRLGKTVFYKKAVDCNTMIDLSDKPSDMYFMSYFSENRRHVEAIVLNDR